MVTDAERWTLVTLRTIRVMLINLGPRITQAAIEAMIKKLEEDVKQHGGNGPSHARRKAKSGH